MDETYIKVRGRWMHLCRAIDSNGDTVEFWLSERRSRVAAKLLLSKALKRHGRPERIVIDGSQTNREAILGADLTCRLCRHEFSAQEVSSRPEVQDALVRVQTIVR